MRQIRGMSRPAQFAIGTAGLSALAWLETFVSGRAQHDRLAYSIFDRLFIYTDNWGAALEVAIVVVVCLMPRLRAAGARLAVLLGERPRYAAAIACAVLAIAARTVYRDTPLAMDEYAQLAQAYAFAHGTWSWVTPLDWIDRLIPPGFRNYFLAVDPATGQTASLYWPGFAALLTPFVWAGVPWLLNPLLSAATLLLIHALGVRLLGTPTAGGWAVLLTLASPEFTVSGISYYSMTAHLAANLAFVWFVLDGRPSRALLAGLLGGIALILHNPVPHFLFAAPWILWLLLDKTRWFALLALTAGYLPGVGVGIAWPLCLGHLTPHVAAATEPLMQLIVHKLRAAFTWPNWPVVRTRFKATVKIWLWSAPGLPLLALAGLRAAATPLRLLAAAAFLTYGVYWFVPFDQGHGWGYRYFHSAWGALPLLGAAFLVKSIPPLTASATAEASAARSIPTRSSGWWGLVGGLAFASLILGNGLRFVQVHSIIGALIAQVIPAPSQGRWVRFVTWNRGMYTWDRIQNMPGETRTLTLMSFGADADSVWMAQRFPGAERRVSDARGSLWALPP